MLDFSRPGKRSRLHCSFGIPHRVRHHEEAENSNPGRPKDASQSTGRKNHLCPANGSRAPGPIRQGRKMVPNPTAWAVSQVGLTADTLAVRSRESRLYPHQGSQGVRRAWLPEVAGSQPISTRHYTAYCASSTRRISTRGGETRISLNPRIQLPVSSLVPTPRSRN